MASADKTQFKAYAAHEIKANLAPYVYTPRVMQPNDIDIAITHCGVCHTDLHSINDDWGMTKFPVVPGHEVIGTVTALGSNVKNIKIGTRVGVGPNVGGCLKCEDCHNGETNLCPDQILCYGSLDLTGHMTYGGFAEGMRVDSRFVYPVPDDLPSETAAPLLCAGVTVFSPLKRYVTKPKSVVGVIGIGGLGHLGIQFAKAMGFQTLAFSSSPSKEKEAIEFGADHFIDSSKKDQMDKWKRKVDFLLSTVALNLDWDQYIDLLRPDGRLCFVGVPEGNYSKINMLKLIFNRISVTGSPIGNTQDYHDMLRLAADKHIVAKTELFKFSEANKALEKVRDNTVRYRGVLVADERIVEAYNRSHGADSEHKESVSKKAKTDGH